MMLPSIQRQMAAALKPGIARAAISDSLDTLTGTLSVHRRTVSGTIVRALQHVYPVCLEIIGGTCFEHLALAYWAEYPSRTPDLAEYGAHFSRFIRPRLATTAFEGLEYLEDLARLEWLCHLSSRSPDRPHFDWSMLARVSAQRQAEARLELCPSLSVLQSAFPLVALWHGRTAFAGSSCVVVTRPEYRVKVESISLQELTLLTRIQERAALVHLPEQDALPALISKGWIVGASF